MNLCEKSFDFLKTKDLDLYKPLFIIDCHPNLFKPW